MNFPLTTHVLEPGWMVRDVQSGYMPTEREFADKLFARASNQERAELLLALISKNEIDKEAKKALMHFLRCSTICIDNRNVIMHALVRGADAEIFGFVNRPSRRPGEENYYRVPLHKLRLIADQAGDMFMFGLRLYGWLMRRNSWVLWKESPPLPWPLSNPSEPGPLPDIPPVPTRLTREPPEEDEEG
jgi:hypothetical protein